MKIQLLGLLALTFVACAQSADADTTTSAAVSARGGRNDLFTRMGGDPALSDMVFGVQTDVQADPGSSRASPRFRPPTK